MTQDKLEQLLVETRKIDFLRNPVTVKELRSRMRGRRAFVVLTIYLLLMSCFITMVYLAYAAASGDPFGPSSGQAGKVVFGAVLAIQIFLVIFIGPAFTAASISGEKERQTYDLLRTTLLSARSLVTGKLLSAMSYVFLLIIVALPLQGIAFMLGGISPIELVISQVLVMISAVAYALLGLFFSSIMRSTLTASVSTYATAIALTMGVPTVAGIAFSILGPLIFGPSVPGWPFEALLVYLGLLLAATNLPATIIVSEVFLLEQNSLFIFTEMISGRPVYLFSPWFVYTIFYGLISLLLFWATIRRVKKIAVK